MLDALIVILLVLWLLGFFAFSLGAFVHLLLLFAVVVLIIRLIGGRPRTA